ncbi:MAG: YjgP/YjgQ family permease, partial [Acidobacteria bacterium]|nr:YjgP/YjgQ family permease [Acidobacteriota bacterium]
MKRIDKMVCGAVIPPFLIALTVLTFVVFVQELGKLSELFITRNASLDMIGAFAGAIVPGILAYAMPLSFLIGTMVAMSGLSGESQIVALRSCGVPLRRLLWPLLALALLAAGVTGLITNYLVPRTALIISYLKYRVNIRQLTSQIQPRVFNEGFPDLVFYLDDLALDRQKWSRVFVADNSDPGGPRIILARQGSWITDRKGTQLQLNLEDGRVYQVDPNDPTRDNMSVFDTTDIPVAVRGLASANGRAMTPLEARRPAEMSTSALWRPAAAI